MAKIVKEITNWECDFESPNHTYLLDDNNKIIAYALYHGEEICILSNSNLKLDKRYRKFVDSNHSGLSELIPRIELDIHTFKIKSKDNEYFVTLKNKRYSCTCMGFNFRGKCKHIDSVAKNDNLKISY